MPSIEVQTSIWAPAKSEVEAMLKSLSAKLAKHTGKPESYTIAAFEADVPMTGGTSDPVCDRRNQKRW